MLCVASLQILESEALFTLGRKIIIVRRGSAPTISEKIHIKSAICRRGLNLDSYERQESKLVMYATQITNTSDLHLQFIVKKYFQFGLFAPPMGQDGQAGWCKAPPGRFALYAWASYPTTVKLYCKMKKKVSFCLLLFGLCSSFTKL